MAERDVELSLLCTSLFAVPWILEGRVKSVSGLRWVAGARVTNFASFCRCLCSSSSTSISLDFDKGLLACDRRWPLQLPVTTLSSQRSGLSSSVVKSAIVFLRVEDAPWARRGRGVAADSGRDDAATMRRGRGMTGVSGEVDERGRCVELKPEFS